MCIVPLSCLGNTNWPPESGNSNNLRQIILNVSDSCITETLRPLHDGDTFSLLSLYNPLTKWLSPLVAN